MIILLCYKWPIFLRRRCVGAVTILLFLRFRCCRRRAFHISSDNSCFGEERRTRETMVMPMIGFLLGLCRTWRFRMKQQLVFSHSQLFQLFYQFDLMLYVWPLKTIGWIMFPCSQRYRNIDIDFSGGNGHAVLHRERP